MIGLWFTTACEIRPGDHVVVGGVARKVLAVEREGKDAPLFRLEGWPDWISWMCCGQEDLTVVQGRVPRWDEECSHTEDRAAFILVCPCNFWVRGCRGICHPNSEHSCPHAEPDSDGYDIHHQKCRRIFVCLPRKENNA